MRVAVLVDTPNITKGVHQHHGNTHRPDYREVLQLASGMGEVVCGKALVNDGLPQHQVVKLHDAGLTVVRSHAFDCDEPMIAWAVRLHNQVDCLILCTGDKHFRSVVRLLQAAGRKVVVCAVSGSCNASLRALCDQYLEMPIMSSLSSKPGALRRAGTYCRQTSN